MNQVQVIQLLNTLSVPSFYGQAPIGTVLPFLTIHSDQNNNYNADNSVFCEGWSFRIDLYSTQKSLSLEKEIKDLLNGSGIPWIKTEEYLSDENCWEVEFEFQVLGDEEVEDGS